jgi:hypothetical protein
LPDVARFALQVYWQREDFTLLHVVTGCHAFRLVLPFTHDRAMAVRYLWQAVLVACLTVAWPPKEREALPPEYGQLTADAIASLAVRSADDHLIKLCYSALCEYREYGNDRYLWAAGRKLALAGLLAPALNQAC